MASVTNSYIATQTGGGTTLTIPSVTIAAGEVLIVAIGMRYGNTGMVTGITWNTSETMSEAIETTPNAWTNTIWQLANPTATTANVVISFSTNIDRPKIAVAYAVANVDTAVMTEATGTGYASSGTGISTSITTLTDNALIIDMATQVGTNDFTPAGDQTQFVDQTVTGSFSGHFGSSAKTLASAGATTMTWTSAGSAEWESCAIALKAAVAAPVYTNVMQHHMQIAGGLI